MGLNVANYFKNSRRPALRKFEFGKYNAKNGLQPHGTNLHAANQFAATDVHALRKGRTKNMATHLLVMNIVHGKPIEIATL
jgi:hypothetical protein